ncbi:mCpol domain-containing protein [Streptomyces lincolnensis]|uniref:mCpol domain-containing protein n=1 Tax=Streptomyces lincolnensis TaxID=1915 RepID=UPI001E51E4E2|nr:mCpol domain-containing protein [Streptomyces lincolnensis]MCD7437296.1 mCpol domain-containing protein [Streptomyces lincolnensis]
MAFAIIDGDNVGNKVEKYILANNVEGFIESSRMISRVLQRMADRMTELPGVSLVHTGGDSILIEIEDASIDLVVETLEKEQNPGLLTFSAGVGSPPRRSFLALRMAKSSGKCQIIRFHDEAE